MKSKVRSLLTYLIGWPLSIIALIFIIRLILTHLTELQAHLNNINYSLIAIGSLCFFLYYFLRSYVYQKILNYLGYPLTLQQTAFHWGQSEMHRYIPGNVWAFLGRTVLFSKKEVDKKDITLSLIVESQLVLVGTLIVTLLGVPFILRTLFPAIPYQQTMSILAVVLVAMLVFLYMSFSKAKRFVKKPLFKKILFTPFSPKENALLVGISSVCYLFFGLGYYFIFVSIFPLHPQMIWELTGFFVFSLLVGYLSILTPTGLGIREGILILGLKSSMTVPLVGFASIFTRIILILSEVGFLILTFLWHQTKNSYVTAVENFFSERKAEVLLLSGVLTYAIYFSIASVLRYTNFYTGRFDLGNMAQTVWNTSRGDIFILTDPNGTEIVSRLAFHADFILILLAPFYWIWSDPRMLLLIQACTVAIGGIFVYLIAQKILKTKYLSLLFAFMYLLNPSVQRATLYDFHAVVLATTFLLAAFYFLLEKRRVWLLIFLLLAAITKEQVWLIVSFFGLYIGVFQKKYIYGTTLFLIGAIVFTYLVFTAIPMTAGSEHFALAYYSDYGDKPSSIVKNILFSPHKTIPLLFQSEQLRFFRQLFGPMGYISLLSPLYLIFAAGDFMIDFLSSNPQLHQIYYQYTATLSPFIFISALYGAKRLLQIFPKIPRFALGFYLLIATILSAYLYGPLPGSKEPNLAMFASPLKNAAQIDNYLQQLPRSYSVAASNNLGSHLSHRDKIYTIPRGIEQADIVALLHDPTTVGSDRVRMELLNRLRNDPDYLTFYDFDGFVVFKKIQTFNLP